jgi:hypothetical protein
MLKFFCRACRASATAITPLRFLQLHGTVECPQCGAPMEATSADVPIEPPRTFYGRRPRVSLPEPVHH